MKTSYSIPKEFFNQLSVAAEKTGESKANLMKRCLLKQMRYMHRAEILHGPVVQYNNCAGKGYKRINICWNEKEYGIIQQNRFYMRYSTSRLFAMSINKMLEKIVRAIIRLKKKKRPINKNIFKQSLGKIKKLFIYWPYIDTDEIPFLAQRWNFALF